MANVSLGCRYLGFFSFGVCQPVTRENRGHLAVASVGCQHEYYMRLNVRVSTLRAVTSVWGGHLLLKNGRAVDCSRSSCQANVHGAQLVAHSVCSGLSASRHEPSGALTLWMDQLVCYWQGNGPSISSLSSFFFVDARSVREMYRLDFKANNP